MLLRRYHRDNKNNEEKEEIEDINSMNKRALNKLAKELGIENYTDMEDEELRNKIIEIQEGL